jgi:hypothetical protein
MKARPYRRPAVGARVTRHTTPPVDSIVLVPVLVSRRAWECAFMLGGLHSSDINCAALWHRLQHIVVARDPLGLTWAECAMLFRVYRHIEAAHA